MPAGEKTIERIIGILGLILGVYALWDSRQSSDKLIKKQAELVMTQAELRAASEKLASTQNAQTPLIRSIYDSTPTQFLKEFPYDIPLIREAVANAHHNVDIMVDTLAYGLYGSTKESLSLLDALKAAQRSGAHVRILVPDSIRDLHVQEWRQKDFQPDGKLADLMQAFPKERPPTSWSELADLLERRATVFRGELKDAGVDVHPLSRAPEINFWVADENVIIGLPTTNGESSFRSRDQSLVNALKLIFEPWWSIGDAQAATGQ